MSAKITGKKVGIKRVGIVIRTKDRPVFVTRALRSVFAQTYPHWEIALINDGGDPDRLSAALDADGLCDLSGFAAVKRLDMPNSIGRSDAFNRGVEALKTEFVCCLDDDDTWEPEFLERLVAFFDQTHAHVPDLGGVAALVTAIREDLVEIEPPAKSETGAEKGTTKIVQLGTDKLPNSFTRNEFFLNPIAYATYRHDVYPVQWMLRREYVQQVGGFPSEFNVMEDRAFMVRFLEHWRLAMLDEHLAYHHRRAKRHGDTAQTVEMNTLDNPSYDWRFYADLSKVRVNSPPSDTGGAALNDQIAGALIRSAAAQVVKEINDETSALWHKINGEAATLRQQIAELEARVGAVLPPEGISAPEDARVWSLWSEIQDHTLGYSLEASHPFLERFTLSMTQNQPGLLLHADAQTRRMSLQIPDTRDFCALEFSLAGLSNLDGGVTCEIVLGAQSGYLCETALSVWTREGLKKTHKFVEKHVHACPAGGYLHITREFAARDLGASKDPKFSLILPAQARNFRLDILDIAFSRRAANDGST